MEPQLPTPHPSAEMGPTQPGSQGESLPTPQPERVEAPRVEQQPAPISQEKQGFEQQTQSSGGGDPAWQAPTVTSVTTPAVELVAKNPISTATDDTPLTANDDDLIEQEWVQKAKKIVNSTKSDPYLQEKEVSKLQADYLQKRYGKEIKQPGQ